MVYKGEKICTPIRLIRSSIHAEQPTFETQL